MTNPPTRYETQLNYVTVALLAGLLSLSVYGVTMLPDRIPVHYNLNGEPDRWGSPTTLLIPPFLCLLIEGLLWAVRRVPPELMNFPGLRTPDNVAWQMRNSHQLLATLRALIAALFVGLIGQWVWTASHDQPRPTLWIPFVFVGLLLISTGIFMVRAYRMAGRS